MNAELEAGSELESAEIRTVTHTDRAAWAGDWLRWPPEVPLHLNYLNNCHLIWSIFTNSGFLFYIFHCSLIRAKSNTDGYWWSLLPAKAHWGENCCKCLKQSQENSLFSWRSWDTCTTSNNNILITPKGKLCLSFKSWQCAKGPTLPEARRNMPQKHNSEETIVRRHHFKEWTSPMSQIRTFPLWKRVPAI